MRCPVYRNLDRPFQIMGFTAIELFLLCFALVGGTEAVKFFRIERVWAFAFTFFLGASFFVTRRLLGQLFVRRLLRFIILPSVIVDRLFPVKEK